MENRWHKAEAVLLDHDSRSGTVSVFAHYDLLNWTFGVRAENDLCWYDFIIELGPIRFSFCYWREWPAKACPSLNPYTPDGSN